MPVMTDATRQRARSRAVSALIQSHQRYQGSADVEGEAVTDRNVRYETPGDDQRDEYDGLYIRQAQPVQHTLAHAEQDQKAGNGQQNKTDVHGGRPSKRYLVSAVA